MIMDEIVERSFKAKTKYVLISGSPGIGKTVYLYLRLTRNLLEGNPMLFQDHTGVVFHITDTIERLPDRFSFSFKVYSNVFKALVNADRQISEPNVSLESVINIKMVVTSSPKPYKQRKWMKQHADGYLMAKWDWQELLPTAVFFSQSKIDLKGLQEITNIVGYNPRICFEASKSPESLLQATADLQYAIRDIKSFDRLAEIFGNRQSIDKDLPHCLFDIIPLDSNRLYTQPLLDVKSTYILNLLMNQIIGHNLEKIREFQSLVGQTPTMAAVYRRIWEEQVL